MVSVPACFFWVTSPDVLLDSSNTPVLDCQLSVKKFCASGRMKSNCKGKFSVLIRSDLFSY